VPNGRILKWKGVSIKLKKIQARKQYSNTYFPWSAQVIERLHSTMYSVIQKQGLS